jgi:predicted phosphodiesterase
MIRVLYMSDLHLEMERWRLAVPGWPDFMARHRAVARHPARGPMLDGLGRVDLVVLAGDIHNGLRGVVYAEQVAEYLDAPVVMVAGNHEFYYHDVVTLLPGLRAASGKTGGRVRFLENTHTSFDVAGRLLHVLGCTLWTDYALHGTVAASMQAAGARMNDHRFIRLQGAAFQPRDALASHEASLFWLRQTMAALRAGPPSDVLVVSHHAPSGAVLGARTGMIAPAYGSKLLGRFEDLRPDAWIHGHTHHRHDSLIGGVRLVSAPRGYVTDGDSGTLGFRPGILTM